MVDDTAVIEAVSTAVDRDPGNRVLRLHLIELLLSAGRYDDALRHCGHFLNADADDAEALALAARAMALRAAAPSTPAQKPPPERMSVADDSDLVSVGDMEIDAFLADVLYRDPDERVTLDHVAGLYDVKKRLNDAFLAPMRNPELRQMYAKSLRGGLLLWGPPGCGKTYLARAVAGDLGARFFAVGLHDVLDMWFGRSEQNVHALFDAARRAAPCVVFLDEVDALGMRRNRLVMSAGRNVVVQFLAELDGVDTSNEGVFVLAATNQPWDVDPALRRPGRLDRTLLVLPPDVEARRAILERHLRDRPTGDIDVGAIAAATETYSGADLRAICDTAAERALADSLDTGVARPVGQGDLTAALAEVRPSTRPWFESARNYATYAADEDSTYDALRHYLDQHFRR